MKNNIIPFHYQGKPVRFNTEGWLHATEIATRFNKEPYEWLTSPDTAIYLSALAEVIGFNSLSDKELIEINGLETRRASSKAKLLRFAKKTGLVITKAGSPETGGGTWLHPKLAVVFARWLDVRFAVWCDLHIDALLRGELDEKYRFDQACAALTKGQEQASMSATELAKWRWKKPELKREVNHWRDQLQLTLGFDINT